MGNQLVVGSLNQTLESIRTNAASVQSIVWDPQAPIVTDIAPGSSLQNSSVTITPTILNTLLSTIPLSRALTLGLVYFGNIGQELFNDCALNTFANLGWVIRAGAVPADLSRQATIAQIIGNQDAIYSPPTPPISTGSRYSIGVYAKVVNTSIQNQEQARQALLDDSSDIFTVSEELFYINLTGTNGFSVSTVPSAIKLYPQSTISIPGASGVYWKEINASTQDLSYIWVATPESVSQLANWQSNPDDFPSKITCIPCIEGYTCDDKTGLCTSSGSSDTPWYKTWWFITIIAVVGFLIILLLILAIARAAKKRKLAKTTLVPVAPVASAAPVAASAVPVAPVSSSAVPVAPVASAVPVASSAAVVPVQLIPNTPIVAPTAAQLVPVAQQILQESPVSVPQVPNASMALSEVCLI